TSAGGVRVAAMIRMVTEASSADSLTGVSPYFFRVSPTNKVEGIVGAQYAQKTLHAKNVALFEDQLDRYSSSLAQDFMQQFTSDGNKIAVTEHYTVGKPANLATLLQDALNHN